MADKLLDDLQGLPAAVRPDLAGLATDLGLALSVVALSLTTDSYCADALPRLHCVHRRDQIQIQMACMAHGQTRGENVLSVE